MMMNFETDYPVWSTGDIQSNYSAANLVSKCNSGGSGQCLNASDVPAWDFQDQTVQVEFKTGLESAEEPAWATSTATWDHESATRLAEQLLKVQMDSPNFSSADDQKDSMSMSSMSEIHPRGGHQFAAGSGVPNPRFKTEFCRNFREKGDCVYGSQCQFAHGKAELRHDMIRHSKYKTKLCQKYWINGWCAYGTRCNFIHQEEESYMTEKTRITVNQCGFRPLVPSRNLRKSSESSADSGIDPGLIRHGADNTGMRQIDVSVVRMNKIETRREPPICMKSYQSSIINCNLVNDNKSDLVNMNLATELNRNLYMDIANVKEKSIVPHPEDNPIPGPAARFQQLQNNAGTGNRFQHLEAAAGARFQQIESAGSVFQQDQNYLYAANSVSSQTKNFRALSEAPQMWNC